MEVSRAIESEQKRGVSEGESMEDSLVVLGGSLCCVECSLCHCWVGGGYQGLRVMLNYSLGLYRAMQADTLLKLMELEPELWWS